MMFSPFNPPNHAERMRVFTLAEKMRRFDANMRAAGSGYRVVGHDPFGLPVADPHGEPWSLLTNAELESRKHWCMLPEQHDALQAQLQSRAARHEAWSDELRRGVR